ncbi:RHS repeat domain-containing protein [Corallococcus exercitus]|uniref:RHS repeat protein n=1 Tax=Corallococcus exercitus TaxID=2316736 RepID=A0A7Y4KKP9_9BACT|nr:RHS repeat-associated core domain-containing protein [Corallococcus exercitus]NOK35578.1 RHS repeat protein [Corallococcus exercitus]
MFTLYAAMAQAQTTTYAELSKAVKAPNAVTAIGTDLFGDQVNLYSGRLEFTQTDVSLPGNSKLPVAVGRRLITSIPGLSARPFGRWLLDIPHIRGTFSTRDGWKAADGTYARCSSFGAPPPALGANNSGHWEPEEFWQGNSLYIPGEGEQQLLRRSPDNTLAPGPVDSYPVVTSKFWSASCLSTLANSTTDGEGFLVVSPEGTKYRFDQLVTYRAKSLSKPAGFLRAAAAQPYLDRVEVWLLPTLITDRFGNTVQYTYDPANPENVTTISASDGRVLRLFYGNASSPKVITSVTDGVRTWTYSYRATSQGVPDLNQVALPDGTSWQFSGTDPLFQDLQYLGGPSCDYPANLNSYAVTGTMRHPTGASGSFTLTPTTHGRSNVYKQCWNYPDGSTFALVPRYFDTYALTRKDISGPGLSNMAWTYDYGPTNASWEPCGAGCPSIKIVTVTDPRGERTRYIFGNSYNVSEGQLQRVDTGWNGTTALSTRTLRYRAPDAGPYPSRAGTGSYNLGDGDLLARYMPVDAQAVTQQDATFLWTANGFDTLVRPTSVTRSSSLGYSRTETTTYSDNLAKWVLGQVATVTESSTGKVMEANTYDAATATLATVSRFGALEQTLTYYPDGTLATRKDGRNSTTTYSNYKAGLPQNTSHPTGASESAVINGIGQITSTTDAAGFMTSYGYDAMGRLNLITYPTSDTVAWNATSMVLEPIGSAEYGLPAGHWRQTVTTGNARTVTYLDALLRPQLTRTFDAANEAGTRRMVLRRFDFNGKPTFESYAQRTLNDVSENPAGTSTTYDALGRVTSLTLASELGNLTTTTQYLDGFVRRVTSARNQVTDTRFWALDQPSEGAPATIVQPYGLTTTFTRNVFGQTTGFTRGVDGVFSTRTYAYDANQRLCKSIEPETGATVQTYDAAGNVAWRATGLSLPSTSTCDSASVPAARKVTYGYDALNRVTSTLFGDASPSITQTYTADGLPLTNTSNGAAWTNTYNRRRLLEEERLTYGGKTYFINRAYDANASLARLTYPDTARTAITYSPNALGEPTVVSYYANDITYHPNGAIAGFVYANGLVHTMMQNTRGLPRQVSDTSVLNDVYSYDENGNVIGIADQQQGVSTRNMAYDGLDRLYSVSAPGLWGTVTYNNDALDNIISTTMTAGATARTSTHNIDYARNRLSSVTGNAAPYSFSYGYDGNGNITQRGGQAYTFDLANRMTSATGKATYSYDGRGRRIQIVKTDGSNQTQLQLYTQDGQLLYGTTTVGSSAPVESKYVYLNGTLLADIGVSYIHTDGLGSVVARTDSARTIQNRTYYEPYGLTHSGAQPTIGFAGHVNDSTTGLTYMQQRYYDPVAGRFLSNDPVTMDVNTGVNFNRYAYAYNNPYSYIDPDGREPDPVTDLPRSLPAPPPSPMVLPLPVPLPVGAPIPAFPAGTTMPVVTVFGQSNPPTAAFGSWLLAQLIQSFERSPLVLATRMAGILLSKEKDVPDKGPPGEWIVGRRRERKYGPNGQRELDIDYGHNGHRTPHVHEWDKDGQNHEHPGREVSLWPRR